MKNSTLLQTLASWLISKGWVNIKRLDSVCPVYYHAGYNMYLMIPENFTYSSAVISRIYNTLSNIYSEDAYILRKEILTREET